MIDWYLRGKKKDEHEYCQCEIPRQIGMMNVCMDCGKMVKDRVKSED